MTMHVNARKDGREETAMRVSIISVFPLHICENVQHSVCDAINNKNEFHVTFVFSFTRYQ